MTTKPKEFDPGPLEALTLEQREVFSLLSRGVMRFEVGRRRQAQTEEIFDVIDSVNQLLDTPNSVAATYKLLKEGAIELSEDDISDAKDKVCMLTVAQKDILKAVMGGHGYSEIGLLLGMTDGDIRAAMDDITATIHSHSPEQTVRLAFAAGLEFEVPVVETEPETQEKGPAPESLRNTLEFLSWMYPKLNPRELAELDEEQLVVTGQAIKAAVQDIVKSLPTPKLRRQVKPAVTYIDKWLEGQTIPKIAEEAAKNDGSVRLSLTGLAAKIGDKINFYDLTQPSE